MAAESAHLEALTTHAAASATAAANGTISSDGRAAAVLDRVDVVDTTTIHTGSGGAAAANTVMSELGMESAEDEFAGDAAHMMRLSSLVWLQCVFAPALVWNFVGIMNAWSLISFSTRTLTLSLDFMLVCSDILIPIMIRCHRSEHAHFADFTLLALIADLLTLVGVVGLWLLKFRSWTLFVAAQTRRNQQLFVVSVSTGGDEAGMLQEYDDSNVFGVGFVCVLLNYGLMYSYLTRSREKASYVDAACTADLGLRRPVEKDQ